MDKLEKSYKLLFDKLEKLHQENDNEVSHILQDKIYRKFIKDISNDKFTSLKDIKKIGNIINKKVVKNDIGRWYA
jgi:hypothetical protein